MRHDLDVPGNLDDPATGDLDEYGNIDKMATSTNQPQATLTRWRPFESPATLMTWLPANLTIQRPWNRDLDDLATSKFDKTATDDPGVRVGVV